MDLLVKEKRQEIVISGKLRRGKEDPILYCTSCYEVYPTYEEDYE